MRIHREPDHRPCLNSFSPRSFASILYDYTRNTMTGSNTCPNGTGFPELLHLTVPNNMNFVQSMGVFFSMLPVALMVFFFFVFGEWSLYFLRIRSRSHVHRGRLYTWSRLDFYTVFTRRLQFIILFSLGCLASAVNQFILKPLKEQARPDESCLKDTDGFPSGWVHVQPLITILITFFSYSIDTLSTPWEFGPSSSYKKPSTTVPLSPEESLSVSSTHRSSYWTDLLVMSSKITPGYRLASEWALEWSGVPSYGSSSASFSTDGSWKSSWRLDSLHGWASETIWTPIIDGQSITVHAQVTRKRRNSTRHRACWPRALSTLREEHKSVSDLQQHSPTMSTHVYDILSWWHDVVHVICHTIPLYNDWHCTVSMHIISVVIQMLLGIIAIPIAFYPRTECSLVAGGLLISIGSFTIGIGACQAVVTFLIYRKLTDRRCVYILHLVDIRVVQVYSPCTYLCYFYCGYFILTRNVAL